MTIEREIQIVDRPPRTFVLALHAGGAVTVAVEDPSSVAIIDLLPEEIARLAAAAAELAARP